MISGKWRGKGRVQVLGAEAQGYCTALAWDDRPGSQVHGRNSARAHRREANVSALQSSAIQSRGESSEKRLAPVSIQCVEAYRAMAESMRTLHPATSSDHAFQRERCLAEHEQRRQKVDSLQRDLMQQSHCIHGSRQTAGTAPRGERPSLLPWNGSRCWLDSCLSQAMVAQRVRPEKPTGANCCGSPSTDFE